MLVKCIVCGKERDKKPADCKRTTNNFCSRSCSSKYNGKIYPKRRKLPLKVCLLCDNNVESNHKKYCNNCNLKNKDFTLSEVVYLNHHKSSAFALVRCRARAVAKKLGWKSCKKCGYSKHIEIAHIKPIAEYDLETKISVINHPDNLIPLCPNCHWEFDNSKI